MKATYQNLNDESDPDNGGIFTNGDGATLLFDENAPSRRRPFTFELVSENDEILSVGVEGEFGFAQYTRDFKEALYQVAVDPVIAPLRLPDIELVVGGTLTPISGKYRISLDRLKRIVIDFLENGERSSCVRWQDI